MLYCAFDLLHHAITTPSVRFHLKEFPPGLLWKPRCSRFAAVQQDHVDRHDTTAQQLGAARGPGLDVDPGRGAVEIQVAGTEVRHQTSEEAPLPAPGQRGETASPTHRGTAEVP